MRPWKVVSWSSTCWNKAGRLARNAPARLSVMATPSASALMLLRCSSREDRAEVTLASSAVRMRSSNQDWMPRLKNAAANTATTMDGVTATTPNISTRRTCRRDPAEPRRRSTQTRVTRAGHHGAQQQQHRRAGQDGDEHHVRPQRDRRAARQQHEGRDGQQQRHGRQHQRHHLAQQDIHQPPHAGPHGHRRLKREQGRRRIHPAQPMPRTTGISRSRIFLRSVLRLRPSIAAALIWLPRVADSVIWISGRSTSAITRS